MDIKGVKIIFLFELDAFTNTVGNTSNITINKILILYNVYHFNCTQYIIGAVSFNKIICKISNTVCLY